MSESIQLTKLEEECAEALKRCLGAQVRLKRRPTFCRTTALRLLGIECPRVRQHDDGRLERVVSTANAHHVIRGVRDVRWNVPVQTQLIGGAVECTSPECTWLMMSPVLSEEELIVLGDSMMRRDYRLKRTTKEELERFLDWVRQWKDSDGPPSKKVWGYGKCVDALPFLKGDTDSSMETRLRLTLQRFGLPAPEVNFMVENPVSGAMMLLDMAYPKLKIAIEYDGRFHDLQWEADVERRKMLDELGWDVIQVTASDMRTESSKQALAMRVSNHIAARSGKKVVVGDALTMRQLMDGRRVRRM